MVSLHPKNQQVLVISSFGDLINWSFDSETGEETQTVMNVEHNSLLNVDEQMYDLILFFSPVKPPHLPPILFNQEKRDAGD